MHSNNSKEYWHNKSIYFSNGFFNFSKRVVPDKANPREYAPIIIANQNTFQLFLKPKKLILMLHINVYLALYRNLSCPNAIINEDIQGEAQLPTRVKTSQNEIALTAIITILDAETAPVAFIPTIIAKINIPSTSSTTAPPKIVTPSLNSIHLNRPKLLRLYLPKLLSS